MADSFGHFDNDFEKLSGADDEELVSSTGISPQFEFEGVENDAVNAEAVAPKDGAGDTTEFDQLIDFGPVSEPAVTPVETAEKPVAAAVTTPSPTPTAPSCDESSALQPCCSWMMNIDSRVLDLLYWRDIKKTGVVCASSMSLLLSLALFSVISVIAYISLIVMTLTISFRLYKLAMSYVQKSGDENPFKAYLETEIALPNDKVNEYADVFVKHGTDCINRLRHLVLIEDVIDSLKFALKLWVLTYIGSWFNGITLIILATVCLFTLPKVYDTHRTQIDEKLNVACGKLQEVQKVIQEKVPFLGKTKQA